MAYRDNKTNTRRLTVCAMLAALGVILLYIGSLIEVVDISMAVLASLLCVVAVIEYGGSWPWLIYGVTAILSIVLLPNKTPAAFYALFFGFYPILKEKLEKLPNLLSWVLKELVFNIAFAAMALASFLLFFTQNNTLFTQPIILIAIFVLAEVVFVLYDIAMTRLISFYIIKLRRRFKF